jgi:hypothetical protein
MRETSAAPTIDLRVFVIVVVVMVLLLLSL